MMEYLVVLAKLFDEAGAMLTIDEIMLYYTIKYKIDNDYPFDDRELIDFDRMMNDHDYDWFIPEDDDKEKYLFKPNEPVVLL
jgi:hypothetical protein